MCIIIENLANFNLADTLESGQCFRFKKLGDGDYSLIAYGKYLRVYQKSQTDNTNIYFETSQDDFDNIWRGYFDLDRDYKYIFEKLRQDEIIKQASDFCPGLRILRQEPFECLISFIISQNNNIPRIKKIIASLCENFGKKIGGGQYAFPPPEILAELSLDDLSVIRSGFRAKYISDAAKKTASGEINLGAVYDLSLRDAAEYLKKIKGVGDKVAACVLLFAYNRLDAFPIDVRIKKILADYYPNGYDFGEYSGIANAYLYNFDNNIKGNK